MRVLGIDPGTAIVGIGIVDYVDKKMKLVHYDCIYTHKDEHMNNRIMSIYEQLNKIIDIYKPDAVAIEELFYFKNNKTVIIIKK